MTSGAATTRRDGRLVVDVWSDVLCPYCYLGDTLFARALHEFPHRDDVELRHHSFLLVPELIDDVPISLNHFIATKARISPEQAAVINNPVAARGHELGLEFRFDQALAVDSRTAHQLRHFAAAHGRQHEIVTRLFRAYFTEGLNIADHQVLAGLAADAGLDRDAARAALAGAEFAAAVEADREQARRLGITGVPFFVFAGKYAISGAQQSEAFRQALETSWTTTGPHR